MHPAPIFPNGGFFNELLGRKTGLSLDFASNIVIPIQSNL
jgi:hypothetical protein